MGIRGSSTCPIVLNDCQVPVENVLGEIGRGHVIAFNILNVAIQKWGLCAWAERGSLSENAVGYARQRQAFGKTIADFGLVREKLANMAALIYVGEALVYRTVGTMDTGARGGGQVGRGRGEGDSQSDRGILRWSLQHHRSSAACGVIGQLSGRS